MTDDQDCYVSEFEKYDDRHYAEKHLDTLSLLQLIQRFDKSIDHKTGDITNREDYWNCLTAIRNTLSLVTCEEINKAISNLLAKIDKLEARFRNHRHEMTKNYSSKAEF